DSDEIFARIRESFVLDAVAHQLLSAENAKNFLATANAEQWQVEGSRRGSLPDREVLVIQTESPSRVVDEFVTAQVVDFQRFDDGDNALLKVPASKPLKPLVIANQAPRPGQSLTSVGFPGSVSRVVDRSRLQQPSFKSGTASSEQVKPSGAMSTEINADVSGGMSGGPTIDNDTGEVLGINSYGIVGESQAFNFITNAPELRSFLVKNGVTLAQSEMPEEPATSESSFPWWFLIGVVVILGIAVLLVLVIRRKKLATTRTP
ncbi:trypsin-like peptidase domain-containing protein, partial [Mycolicibacterium sp.]